MIIAVPKVVKWVAKPASVDKLGHRCLTSHALEEPVFNCIYVGYYNAGDPEAREFLKHCLAQLVIIDQVDVPPKFDAELLSIARDHHQQNFLLTSIGLVCSHH